MIKATVVCFFTFFSTLVLADSPNRPILRVGVIPGEPMSFYSNGAFWGIAVDLWEEVAKQIGVDYQLIHLSEDINKELKSLASNQYDVVLGPITPTYYRSQLVDFSRPYILDPIGIVIPIEKTKNIVVELISKTGLKFLVLILSIIFIFLSYCLIVWYIDKYKTNSKQSFKAFFFDLLERLMFGKTFDIPNKFSTKLTHFIWVKSYAVLSVTVSAIFISFFTVSALNSEKEDNLLSSSNTVFVGILGEAPYQYAVERGLRVISVSSRDAAFEALKNKKANALVDANVVSEYFLSSNNLTKQFKLSDEVLQYGTFAFSIPYGSKWRENIDKAIIYLREHSFTKQLCRRYLTGHTSETNCYL